MSQAVNALLSGLLQDQPEFWPCGSTVAAFLLHSRESKRRARHLGMMNES